MNRLAEPVTLLIAARAPRRDDKTPAADADAMLTLLAWAEGHGACRGLRPGPGGVLRCCDQLAFEVSDPVTDRKAVA